MKNTKNPQALTDIKVARKASRDAQLASGIKVRAYTFQDRTKVASKKACRGKVSW